MTQLRGYCLRATEAFLKERGVDLRLTIEDFDRDRAALKLMFAVE